MGKEDTFDPWDTSTGLLDNFDFKVDRAWFGEVEDSDSDRLYLFIEGTAVDDEDEEYEDHTERYSLGKGWEVIDDGDEVETASRNGVFNQSTGIGHLILSLKALGEEETEYITDRGRPTKAKTFKGLRMHMVGRVVSEWEDVNNPGTMIRWSLNLPTTLKMKKGKKKGKGKSSPSRKSSPSKSKSSSKSGSKELRGEVVEFAGEFENDEHDDFVNQVLDDDIFPKADKITDNDELHAEVLDPDSDLWEEAH